MADKKKSQDTVNVRGLIAEGVKELHEADNYVDFLEMTAKFPQYSYGNVLAIIKQYPNATDLRTLRAWNKVGRYVIAQQTGIKITALFGVDEKEVAEDGEIEQSDSKNFRKISLFDISQTTPYEDDREYEEYVPTEIRIENYAFRKSVEVVGAVDGFDEILSILEKSTTFPILFGTPPNGVKSCFYPKKKILINNTLSQIDTIQAVLHEIAVSYLYANNDSNPNLGREASNIVFVVCKYLDLDTAVLRSSVVSGAVAEEKERRAMLSRIQKTAQFLIDSIEGIIATRKTEYPLADYMLFASRNRALSMYDKEIPVYMVDENTLCNLEPDSKKELRDFKGYYATKKNLWFDINSFAA